MKVLLLLSGPSAVGKTTISDSLQRLHGFSKVATSSYLKRLAAELGESADKATMQRIGDKLDDDTDFRWVADAVAWPAFSQAPNVDRWLLDSVRKHRQVEIFRERHGDAVFHLHLTAPEKLLRQRYESRMALDGRRGDETPYEQAVAHPNEASARSLGEIADLCIDVSLDPPETIVESVAKICRDRGSDA